ncbi:MAG: class I SAM-dependent methyltransferase [Candidatus Omnitrophica bacterium]|nr:class I SAM-dependent methyltransferase [Candidatus Omnitrophota bacterium]
MNIFNFKKANSFFAQTRKKRAKWAKRLLEKWEKMHVSFFDHRIDELNWPENIFWIERGAFARLYMDKGAKILDLCCGDGYFSEIFWAPAASHIDAVDRNNKALTLAKCEHPHLVITHHKIDILREPFPDSGYDMVCFFEAIEHFSSQNAAGILKEIKQSLKPGGVLVGPTPLIEPEMRGKGNFEHANEFIESHSLETFLAEVFTDVETFETYHPNRKTIYFKCKKT